MKPGVRRSFRGNPCNNQKARTFARAARQRPSNGKAACLSMNSREFPSVPAPRGLGACRPRCYLAPRPCIRARAEPRGEVAEWSIAPHSKCGVPATVPGVRIPPSPPLILVRDLILLSFVPIARERSTIGSTIWSGIRSCGFACRLDQRPDKKKPRRACYRRGGVCPSRGLEARRSRLRERTPSI